MPGVALELARAAFAHRLRQVAVEIGKEQERVGFAILLAHKDQRDMRRQQQHRQHHFGAVGAGQFDQPLALRAVADLVMVLNKIDKGDRRLAAAFHAALLAALRRHFALIDETFGQRARDAFFRLAGEILIVGVGFAGGEDMHGVMQIVVPFAGKQRHGAIFRARMQENHVAAIFGGQMDRSIGNFRTDALGDFDQHMLVGRIFNLVDGVEAQTVKVILPEPEQRRFFNVASCRIDVVGDACAPGRHTFFMEEVG